MLRLVVLGILGLWASQAWSRELLPKLSNSMHEMHEKWMAQYGRAYGDDIEKARRFAIFKDNVEYIESFNKVGNKSYKLGINAFADSTLEEFKASLNGYRIASSPQSSTTLSPSPFRYENVTDIPSSVDWREKGAVTPARAEGGCGCCWAFSAVAATEGINQITTGKLISLSVQQLVDCDKLNGGCQGGHMNEAFIYMIKNGLAAETSYPYEEKDGTCDAARVATPAVNITGYEHVPPNDESALMKAVAHQPVSVAIRAGDRDFMLYKSGIFTGYCGTQPNHGVTAVGYGVAEDGTKYWIMKNTWGPGYGEDGYIRLQKDVGTKEGLCGITLDASYPTM